MAYNKTPFKMMGKSPMMKALIGNQGNLPIHLQKLIKAVPESPAKKYGHSPVKQVEQDSSGTTDVMTGKRKERKAKQDSSGVKNVMTGSPVKQVEQESTGARDVMTGKKAAKKVRQESTGAKDVMTGAPAKMYKKSPVKQKDIKIKDLPDEAVKAGENIVKGVKKLGKKIGNITLSSKERQNCKKAGGSFKKGKCYMPESPAKKKGCSKKY